MIHSITEFLRESLQIEGIFRDPTADEVRVTEDFLSVPELRVADVCNLQAVYAPGMPIRSLVGMNVRVGGHHPPRGGLDVLTRLESICSAMSRSPSPWEEHVAFERLHPFMDGNGRTGRTMWAWHMRKVGQDPFALPFLHRFYYQTLAAQDRGPA